MNLIPNVLNFQEIHVIPRIYAVKFFPRYAVAGVGGTVQQKSLFTPAVCCPAHGRFHFIELGRRREYQVVLQAKPPFPLVGVSDGEMLKQAVETRRGSSSKNSLRFIRQWADGVEMPVGEHVVELHIPSQLPLAYDGVQGHLQAVSQRRYPLAHLHLPAAKGYGQQVAQVAIGSLSLRTGIAVDVHEEATPLLG